MSIQVRNTPNTDPKFNAWAPVAMGHLQTLALSFSPRQRPCDFADRVDDKPRNRVQRTILQGHDPVWEAGWRQFDRQHPEFRSLRRNPQRGLRKNRQKAPS